MKAMRVFKRLGSPLLAGAIGVLAFIAAWHLNPGNIAVTLRELAIDTIQRFFPNTSSKAKVIVVDIDDNTLTHRGSWPLPRSELAKLLSIITAGHPSVVAFDIFFPAGDRHSSKTLAREIERLAGGHKIAPLVAVLPDSDEAFAQSLSAGPTVLGALAAAGPEPSFLNAIRSEGKLGHASIARVDGVAEPHEPLAGAALGIGVLSLSGEEGGIIRRTPLLVSTGQTIAPGLVLEAARIATGAPILSVDGDRRRVKFGSRFVPLGEDGTMRIRWSAPSQWAARTVSATDVLDGRVPAERFEGAAVLIGASTPEAGALRPTPVSPLTPTVQIQADALQQILDGAALHRPETMPRIEIAAMLVFGLAATYLATAKGPVFGFAGIVTLVIVWLAAATDAFLAASLVTDPAGPALTAVIAGNVAGAASFARTRRLKALISRRFEQYLSPDVVKEILSSPERLRRAGEIREMTALFTDIEDFTPMTGRIAPSELIALLDIYFDNLCRLVTEHGGMVDGIVGDAVHAFFNIPLERPNHAEAAIDCGLAIARFSEQFRREPRPARAGFGRTRIGIETGRAIVGDVGGTQRLNYTAHGDAVIIAARLEAANKLFNSQICIGAGAAAAVKYKGLKPLGRIQLKGIATMTEVYTLDPARIIEARGLSPAPVIAGKFAEDHAGPLAS